ncbi:hypothetical protein JCM11491_003973 [Sporobolomyces phaffii]
MYGRPPPPGPRTGSTSGYNHYPQQQQPSGGPPRHAGLGSASYGGHPAPANLPSTPSPYEPHAATSEPVAAVDKFSLFVGSIADGVENGWLERILQVAGPILSFRRPSPPFAFVEYSDPESVLRCLSVVNGTTLQSKNGPEKALLVKADEKTRARLDEYEKTRVLSESTSDLTLQAQQDLASIVARIAAGDSVPVPGGGSDPSAAANGGAGPTAEMTEAQRLAAHLQDLAPEDLPESQRSTTLSSIAAFRERSMRKQTERRELDRQIEERRQAMIQRKLQQQQQQQQQQGPPGSSNTNSGPTRGNVDPQSFNQPIGFVAQEGEQQHPGAAAPEIDDARRERERAEQEHRQQEQIFRDRERRFEQRERGRIQAWERERMRERSIVDQEDRERTFMAERLATWDDEREAERGREAFYVDRVRWRAQRRAVRQREEDFDARDRALEAQRLAQIAQQSDSFLAQHADLFAGDASMGGDPLADGPAPAAVKVSFGSSAKPKAAEAAPKRPTVLGMGEEEEEGRRKRELIPLSYSDDEDEKPKPAAAANDDKDKDKKVRLTGRDKEKRIMEIEDSIPRDKAKLFGWDVKWSSLNEGIINRRVSPFANKCIVEYLGAEEAELLNAVLEHVRAHKPAQDLVDELEPVLDEESTDLVTKVWKVLVTETELAHAGF